ncbi:MAG: Scr1 family TA system antitoxin-like transcriptional regulator [Pseudonocardiaceae bacterium]
MAWRRELAPGRRRMQQDIQRFEAAASVVRVFSPDMVVGLAQTPAYAEAMFRLGRDVGLAEDIQAVVAARLARQSILDDERKKFTLVMGETAVRRRSPSSPSPPRSERIITTVSRCSATRMPTTAPSCLPRP